MIKRAYEPLETHVEPNKVLVIYGSRRVGKTTLLQSYLAQTPLRYKLDSGDSIRTQQVLSSQDVNQILSYVEGFELLAIDEAQGIPNIGLALKIIVDQVPGIRVIATGSSSFEPVGQEGEPLADHKHTFVLYPIAQSELLATTNRSDLRDRLGEFMVYGAYPEVIAAPTLAAKMESVSEIVNSYLLKDILTFDRVRNPHTLVDLLKLLAFQIGHEVSLNELASQVAIDVKTVQRYLDLLEKSFIIFRLGGFNRNLRQEVSSKAKYYFCDVGIRNALIAQFNRLDQRSDVGQLWENFVVIERMKHRAYGPICANGYFWRTYDGQGVDLVEEREGRLFGYECKWSTKKAVAAPRSWRGAYPEAEFSVITPETYQDFVL